jgi:hypothetical protein
MIPLIASAGSSIRVWRSIFIRCGALQSRIRGSSSLNTINREGGVLSRGLPAHFGLTLGQIRAVSRQDRARTHKRHEAGRQGAAV